jgi:hypothetical protein
MSDTDFHFMFNGRHGKMPSAEYYALVCGDLVAYCQCNHCGYVGEGIAIIENTIRCPECLSERVGSWITEPAPPDSPRYPIISMPIKAPPS